MRKGGGGLERYCGDCCGQGLRCLTGLGSWSSDERACGEADKTGLSSDGQIRDLASASAPLVKGGMVLIVRQWVRTHDPRIWIIRNLRYLLWGAREIPLSVCFSSLFKVLFNQLKSQYFPIWEPSVWLLRKEVLLHWPVAAKPECGVHSHSHYSLPPLQTFVQGSDSLGNV